MIKLDLTGQRFGKLVALRPGPTKITNETTWICQCDCGNITTVKISNLRNGHTKSCGCLRHAKSKNFIDLTGQQFGEWTVIEKAPRESYWKCRCSCGVEKEVYAPSLKKGTSTSCGHIKKGRVKKPITGKKIGFLTVLEEHPETKTVICKCDCGNIVEIKRGNLVSGNTQSCGCLTSIGEAYIKRILQENNIPYISQWKPKDLQQYSYDFYADNKYVIEFDGPQHAGQISGYFTKEVIQDIQRRDKEKNEYCLKNNIPLYRIPYEYRDKLTLELLTDEKFLVKEEL